MHMLRMVEVTQGCVMMTPLLAQVWLEWLFCERVAYEQAEH